MIQILTYSSLNKNIKINKNPFKKLQNTWQRVNLNTGFWKWLTSLQYCQDSAIEVVWDFMNFLDFKVNFDLFKKCHIVSWIKFISSNYWQVVEPFKRTFHPIIGSSRIPINEYMIQLLDLYCIIWIMLLQISMFQLPCF